MLSVDSDKFRTLIDEDKPIENVRVALCVDNEDSCGKTVYALLGKRHILIFINTT